MEDDERRCHQGWDEIAHPNNSKADIVPGNRMMDGDLPLYAT